MNASDCLIEPTRLVDLASPITRDVGQAIAQAGGSCQQGQVLATLESRAEQVVSKLSHFKSVQVGRARWRKAKWSFPSANSRVARS